MYIVTQRKQQDSPVYELKPENGKGRIRVMHRNLLLPCEFLPVEKMDPCTETRKEKKKNNSQARRQEKTEQEHSSEDEDEWRGIIGWKTDDRGQVEQHQQTEHQQPEDPDVYSEAG